MMQIALDDPELFEEEFFEALEKRVEQWVQTQPKGKYFNRKF